MFAPAVEKEYGKIIMDWKCKTFGELTAQELYLILRARSAVFVVEQSYVHLDIDGKDEQALHVFAIEKSLAPIPVVSYARVLPGDDIDPEVRIDKLFTSPNRRGDGTAELLVERTQRLIATQWPNFPVRLDAPTYLKTFYEQFGFRKIEGPFLDHGTPFIGMLWRSPATLDALPARLGNGRTRSVDTFDLL